MSMFYMTLASRNDGAGYAKTISLDIGIEDTISMALLKCVMYHLKYRRTFAQKMTDRRQVASCTHCDICDLTLQCPVITHIMSHILFLFEFNSEQGFCSYTQQVRVSMELYIPYLISMLLLQGHFKECCLPNTKLSYMF